MEYLILWVSLFYTSIGLASDSLIRCQTVGECVLVQDSWCKRISAINKTNLESWSKQDRDRFKKAQETKQECKPAEGPELQLKSFRVDCVHESCAAIQFAK
jgi:hypothetical protein